VISDYENSIISLQGNGEGGCAARNLAWRQSSGEWIQFLDGDDYLEADKLANNLQAAEPETDVVYSPILEEDWKKGQPKARIATEYSPEEDHALRWLRWKLCQTGGLLWRRKALESIGGWNESMPHCQDNELCLRGLQAELNFTYDSRPQAIYRIHSEGTVCRKDPNAVVETKMKLQVSFLTWLEGRGRCSESHRNAVGQALLEGARSLARSDLDRAAALIKSYHDIVQPSLTGPAAPLSYQMAYRLFGFEAAERIAAFRR